MGRNADSVQVASKACLLFVLASCLIIGCNEEEIAKLKQRVTDDSIKLESARTQAGIATETLKKWKLEVGVKSNYDYSGPSNSSVAMRVQNESEFHSHMIGHVYGIRKSDGQLERLGGLFYETALTQLIEDPRQSILDEFIIDKSFNFSGNTVALIVGLEASTRDSSFSRVRHSVVYKSTWPQGGIHLVDLNSRAIASLINIVDTNVYKDVRMITGVHRECYEQTSYRVSKTTSSMSLPVLVSEGAIYEQNGRTTFRYDLWLSYVSIFRTILAAKHAKEATNTTSNRLELDTSNISVKFFQNAVAGFEPETDNERELVPKAEQLYSIERWAKTTSEKRALKRTKDFLDTIDIEPYYLQNEEFRGPVFVPK